MKHILRFMGRYENNFDQLTPNPEYFISATGKKTKLPPTPAELDGAMFYVMEDMTGQRSVGLIVMVEGIKLENPVKLEKSRHADGKGIGPAGSSIGDNSAVNILRDAIETNADSSEQLLSVGKKFFPAISWDKGRDGKTEEEKEERLDLRLTLLRQKKQIILYGPPGTGKTFSTRSIAAALLTKE